MLQPPRPLEVAVVSCRLAAVGFLAALVLGGCTTHIAPYRAKTREFDAGEYGAKPRARGGSLFAEGQRHLVEDDRAARVGDLIIIQVDEADSAVHDANTKINSKNKISLGLTGAVVNAIAKAYPAADLTKLLGSDSDFGFGGQGRVQRQGTMRATLPVRVRKVLPNDDFYVEGTKVVMVGNEEHHLYVSGIVRAIDIRPDGSVPSSRVADAEIEYTGRGDIQDQQRPGWLARLLAKLWPL